MAWHAVHAITVNTSTNIYITAEVDATTTTPPDNPPPAGGGGSNGAPTPTPGVPTSVNFSGMAYPSSKVVIMQDGVIIITTVADPNANFSAALSGIAQGSYTFSVYAQDKDGNRSASFPFPIYITSGAAVTIGGIILAPTIDVDKSEVKRGDNQIIFGYSVPNSKININVHSNEEHIVTTTTSALGAYLYNLDTSVLEYGDHTAQSRAMLVNNKVSAQTNPVSFKVSNENKNKPAGCGTIIGDLNCDNKINLVDFSILAFWYKKNEKPPENVDLNHDGKTTIVDFSILAYHWTG
ncbi:MAG: Ig-like domain-containing protein [Candidatus Paceibacterota bacterium]